MALATPAVWVDESTVVVDGLTYQLMYGGLEPDVMRVFKPRPMMDAYEPIIEEFVGSNIVELGIYQGGSTAYLAQRCAPRKLVAMELAPDRLPALDRFLADRDLQDSVAVHHGVDQADVATVTSILDAELGDEPIDLVIDDASHQYGPTVASFEAIFPRLRHGGLYLVEDWSGDDFMVKMFVSALRSDERIASRMIEDLLVEDLDDPGSVAVPSFQSFCVRACFDDHHPFHEPIAAWFAQIEGPDATPEQRSLAARLAATVDRSGDEPVFPVSPPTLGTMALELLLAMKSAAVPFDAVAITPWWFAVRRGGFPDLPGFSFGDVGADPLGVLATHGLLHPSA